MTLYLRACALWVAGIGLTLITVAGGVYLFTAVPIKWVWVLVGIPVLSLLAAPAMVRLYVTDVRFGRYPRRDRVVYRYDEFDGERGLRCAIRGAQDWLSQGNLGGWILLLCIFLIGLAIRFFAWKAGFNPDDDDDPTKWNYR